MAWADDYIKQLDDGHVVTFRPQGSSMSPLIKHNQEVTVRPRFNRLPKKGDIVLCTVGYKQYLHLIKDTSRNPSKRGQHMYQISNNRGGVNGWVEIDSIHGFFER